MRTHRLAVARAVWGGVLLTAACCIRRRRCELAQVVTLLGARHLAQAAVTLRWPIGVVADWAWTADVTHGVSMLGLAGLSRRWRPFASVNALVAAGWACAARTASRRDSRRSR